MSEIVTDTSNTQEVFKRLSASALLGDTTLCEITKNDLSTILLAYQLELNKTKSSQASLIDGVLSHALSDIKIPSFESEGYRGGYLACIEKIKEFST
jgi:hypothetical protein